MKVPNYVYFLVIPIFAGALIPVISQFYDVNTYFWSALLVAILGAIVSAIAAIKQVKQPAQPPPGAQGIVELGNPPAPKQRGYLGRMFIGA